MYSADNGFFMHIQLFSGLDQFLNNEKLVKATRTISVTLHFLPLISQHTAGAIVGQMSSAQATTNSSMTMTETTKIQLGIYLAYMHIKLYFGCICMLECELLTLVQASQPWHKNSGCSTL
jgi:hypothetical protein